MKFEGSWIDRNMACLIAVMLGLQVIALLLLIRAMYL